MRVQVNLSNEMVLKVDNYAKIMGVSRSALCSILVGQGIMAFDKSFDVIDMLSEQVSNQLLNYSELKKEYE